MKTLFKIIIVVLVAVIGFFTIKELLKETETEPIGQTELICIGEQYEVYN